MNANVEKAIKAEINEGELHHIWMSFADPRKPKGSQFLGIIVTTSFGPAHAMKKAHDMGINPGGEIQFSKISHDAVADEDYDKLMSEEYIKEKDYV